MATSLINSVMEVIPSLAPVIHLGKGTENRIGNAGDKAKRWSKEFFASNTQITSSKATSNENTSASTPAMTFEKIREQKRIDNQQRLNNLVQEERRCRLRETGLFACNEAQKRRELERLQKYQAERESLEREPRELRP